MRTILLVFKQRATSARFPLSHLFLASLCFIACRAWMPAMSSDANERVCFLSQAAEYLSRFGGRKEAQLGCYYQYTGREIRLKNQVSSFGWDSLKRNCCKTCFISLSHPKTAHLKTRNGFLVVKCLNCNASRKRFRIETKRKTYYEKVVYGDDVHKKSDGDKGPETKCVDPNDINENKGT